MAFTSTITDRDSMGRCRVNRGTFESDSGSTGGDIETGLEVVEFMAFSCEGPAVGNYPGINETLPCAGNAVTIVTDSDETGTWMAIGR